MCAYSRHRWGVTVYRSDGTSRGNLKMGEKINNTVKATVFLEYLVSTKLKKGHVVGEYGHIDPLTSPDVHDDQR